MFSELGWLRPVLRMVTRPKWLGDAEAYHSKYRELPNPRGSAGKGKGLAIVQTKPCDQGTITLDNLSSKIDKLTHIVGSVVPVVKELKRTYDEAGETANDGEREQSSDEDEQPPTKK